MRHEPDKAQWKMLHFNLKIGPKFYPDLFSEISSFSAVKVFPETLNQKYMNTDICEPYICGPFHLSFVRIVDTSPAIENFLGGDIGRLPISALKILKWMVQ